MSTTFSRARTAVVAALACLALVAGIAVAAAPEARANHILPPLPCADDAPQDPIAQALRVVGHTWNSVVDHHC